MGEGAMERRQTKGDGGGCRESVVDFVEPLADNLLRPLDPRTDTPNLSSFLRVLRVSVVISID